ncbi:saccharopine dehydrogenase family protein [Actinomadura xylanilytica]|uniref:saccharopine dehydrogenase family protein n=1 Tax=Actinomadura xylanilytica TaxID=887459 RepID=UPI00255A8B62|nr:saccharopine dehydrogenase NADP-binding domain-containing protein [Actinomadura xylanilytica]MDL4772312.1 saccharopine dehydrogenase NADP-binding domain-containing protein [Actinomadura xylanilytica]
MRILALGGSGAMGAVAVRVAAGLPGVTEIVVADRNLKAAQALVRRLAEDGTGGAPVRALMVEVTDSAALHAALEGSDVVLNTVGPYYRFGLTVLRAAIATRTHYLDICDDWEPTLQMLDLDGEARNAGIRAVVGIGASPGVSNLLAARAVRELDHVQDLYTAWPVDVSGSGGDDEQLTDTGGRPSAAAVHWMEQISGKVTVISGGQLVHRRPLLPVALSVSAGRSGTAYTVGHPEPVTLHRSFHPAGEAANLMVVTRGTLAYLDVLRRDIDAGKLTNETAATDLAKPSAARALRATMGAMTLKGPGSLPPFFAAATGTRDGRRVTALARLADTPGASALINDMAEATGLPLALGLAQLLDGTSDRLGVHPPEIALDAERFFLDLARHIPDLAGNDGLRDGVAIEVTPDR